MVVGTLLTYATQSPLPRFTGRYSEHISVSVFDPGFRAEACCVVGRGDFGGFELMHDANKVSSIIRLRLAFPARNF